MKTDDFEWLIDYAVREKAFEQNVNCVRYNCRNLVYNKVRRNVIFFFDDIEDLLSDELAEICTNE